MPPARPQLARLLLSCIPAPVAQATVTFFCIFLQARHEMPLMTTLNVRVLNNLLNIYFLFRVHFSKEQELV